MRLEIGGSEAVTNGDAGSTGYSHGSNTTTTRMPFPRESQDLYNRVSQNAASPVFKRAIPPPSLPGLGPQSPMAAATKAGLKDNPSMSFVILSDSQVVPPQPASTGADNSQLKQKPNRANTAPHDPSNDPLSHKIESTTRLFEILSSRSDIDHPVCAECTDLLLSSLQARLSAATKERDAYIAFLKNLNSTLPTASDVSKAQSSLASTRAAESSAFSELVSLEQEKASLDAELTALEAESLALDSQEQSFWRSRNAFALTLSSFQNDRDALNAAYDHDAKQLERLQRTNVYNDTFCIGHDGFFGTINGLRLGRLPPPQNVDWAEINAAWGTACLLLATVAEKLGFVFRGYKLKPMGSTSKIEKIDHPTPSAVPSSSTPRTASQPAHPKATSLELFSSGDLPLGRMLLHRRLDAGMVAFLECLRQLGEFVEMGATPTSSSFPSSATASPRKPLHRNSSTSTEGGGSGGGGERGIKLPYEIHKDKIGETSIRLGVSPDEAWTRACKYTLTCCKFLLAHASNVGGAGGKGGVER